MNPIGPNDGAKLVVRRRRVAPHHETHLELLFLAGGLERQRRGGHHHLHPLGLLDDGGGVGPRPADVLDPAPHRRQAAAGEGERGDGRVVEVVEGHALGRAPVRRPVEGLHGRGVVPQSAEEVEVVRGGHVVDEPRVQRADRDDVAGAEAEGRRRREGRVQDRLPLGV
jgi:hypothetical protein